MPGSQGHLAMSAPREVLATCGPRETSKVAWLWRTAPRDPENQEWAPAGGGEWAHHARTCRHLCWNTCDLQGLEEEDGEGLGSTRLFRDQQDLDDASGS